MTSIADRAISREKVPVFWTFGESLRAIGAVSRVVILQALLVSFAEILVSVLAMGAASFVFGFAAGDENAATEPTDQFPEMIGALLGLAVAYFFWVNIMLGISRWVLFQERPTIGLMFSWGRRQWRLLGVSFFCLVAAVVPAILVIVALVIFRLSFESAVMVQFTPLLVILIFVWALGWICMTAPLIASDEPASAIGQAWRLSRGNRLRSIAVFLLVLLSVAIAQGIAARLLKVIANAVFGESSMAAGMIGILPDLIGAVICQAWIASAMAVAFSIITGTNRRLVGGFPAQPA